MVRAHAVVRVEAGPDGSARVTELRSAVPLVMRHTSTSPAANLVPGLPAEARRLEDLVPPALPMVTVHLVGAAAGPLTGDQLRLDISVGTGVRLVLRSVAATLAMPGHGAGPSVLEIHADVAPGGALDLLPEPTVAVRGCWHRMVGRATVAAGGWLRWREEILLGRFGEPSGRIETDLRVDVRSAPAGGDAGSGRRPLLRQQLALGPDTPGLGGAALVGSARAVGSLLIAAPPDDDGGVPTGSTGASDQARVQASGRTEGSPLGRAPAVGLAGLGVTASVSPAEPATAGRVPGGAAVLPLAGPGVLVTALADDAVTLRRHLGD
ncbi:urease accessory protein UreD [Frankia sp. AgB1.9]|uniref:urease accessory protein UreD n=1 Tax=unclassified Frankia TaxID=2632575 RepID=UPI0019317B26|nr:MULTISPECIES: urease accessory protein UreD [unclassified Frankia]MBL7491372.1 urease accessory protein UreD [Frankia sp. AgW1.1]MBL7547047.1 urease accessory protein UreD [Frankia sp. AgB1.9]MBL7621639.1 urease accessory protein UreD [Frankia sp. AgB1.8]